MDATLMRLLGAYFPKIPAGTMVGKLTAMADANVALTESFKNFLRVTVDLFCCVIARFFSNNKNFQISNSKNQINKAKFQIPHHGGTLFIFDFFISLDLFGI